MDEKLIDSIINIKQENVDVFKRMANTVVDEQKDIIINSFSKSILEGLKEQCEYNMQVFKYPFHLNMKREYLLNIGYPMPNEYIKELENYYTSVFSHNNDIENSAVRIQIVPIEYSKSGENIIKYVNDYCLKLELVDIKKDKVKSK